MTANTEQQGSTSDRGAARSATVPGLKAVASWLRERAANARVLASYKHDAKDKAGWLEDADYFDAAVAAMNDRSRLLAVVEAAQAALAPMDLAHDLASAAAADYHASMKGYREHQHKQMDKDVADIAAAASALRDVLSALDGLRQGGEG